MATWAQKWTDRFGQLTSTEILNNAQIAYDYLRDNGYTSGAALGVCANLRAEGLMNPGQWEGYKNYDVESGFGLGQWTPSTKYSNWLGVTAGSREMMNGDKEMEYLVENTGQWSTKYVAENGYSSYYGITTIYFASQNDYAKDSTHSAEELAVAWAAQWERPGSDNLAASSRRRYAAYFKTNLTLSGDTPEAHSVTIQIEGNGTATASPSSATAGTTITLTATPNDDDTFSGWEVVEGNVTITNNTFTMPDEDVIIKAVFTGETPLEPETKKKSKWIYYMRPLWTTS